MAAPTPNPGRRIPRWSTSLAGRKVRAAMMTAGVKPRPPSDADDDGDEPQEPSAKDARRLQDQEQILL